MSASDTLAQHPCSSTAVRATGQQGASSELSILKSCVPLAPSQPYSRRVMPGGVGARVGARMGSVGQGPKKKLGSEKTPPLNMRSLLSVVYIAWWW